jgi:hypothetical protein
MSTLSPKRITFEDGADGHSSASDEDRKAVEVRPSCPLLRTFGMLKF